VVLGGAVVTDAGVVVTADVLGTVFVDVGVEAGMLAEVAVVATGAVEE
jgi:hypothetical protein